MQKLSQKQKEAILQRYNNSYYTSVLDVYDKPSTEKRRIEKRIVNEMINEDGRGYKVLSYNCMMFTCAYTTKEGNIKYFTKNYTWII